MSERLTYYDDGKARFRIGEKEYGGAVADKLAAYEDAEEQGKLVRVPEKYVAARGSKHTLLNLVRQIEEETVEELVKGGFICTGNTDKEKLVEYEKAEKEGCLVILPCNVGEKVYYVTDKINEVEIMYFMVRKGQTRVAISGQSFTSLWCTDVLLENLGKTWFLTRAEAEVALAKQEGNNGN